MLKFTPGAGMPSGRTPLVFLLTVAAAPLLSGAPPTYNKDIAPILYSQCATCHRPGEVAPFSLLTYQDASEARGADRNRHQEPLHAGLETRTRLREVSA